MAKTLQLRRGTTSQISAIAGAVGEILIDTTKDTVVVMDGSTAGGFPLARESALTDGLATKQNALVSGTTIKTINGTSVLGSGNIVISGGSSSVDLTQVSTDVLPSFNDVYDLGSASKRWNDVFVSGSVDINGVAVTGQISVQAGHAAVYSSSSATLSAVVNTGFLNAFTTSNPNQQLSTLIPSSSSAANAVQLRGLAPVLLAEMQALPVGTTITFVTIFGTYVGSTTTALHQTLTDPYLPGQPWYVIGISWNAATPNTYADVNSFNGTYTIQTLVAPATPDTQEYILSTSEFVANSVTSTSALLGDVSIVGNTIAAINSYGVATTLHVDGGLTVNGTIVSTSGGIKFPDNTVQTTAAVLPTASQVLTSIKTVDGTGSGLDADLLEGNHASYFQPALVSGTNIKTVNGTSILGSGNLTISASSSPTNIWRSVLDWQQSVNSSNYTGGTFVNSTFSETLTPTQSGYLMIDYYPKDIYFFATGDFYNMFSVTSGGNEYGDDDTFKVVNTGSVPHGPYRVLVPVTANSPITMRVKWLFQNPAGSSNYFNYGGNGSYTFITAQYVTMNYGSTF